MAEFNFDISARDLFSAQISELNRELKGLTQAFAQVGIAAQYSSQDATQKLGYLLNRINEVRAQIGGLAAAQASVSSAVDAVASKVGGTFAALNAEAAKSLQTTDRWIQSLRSMSVSARPRPEVDLGSAEEAVNRMNIARTEAQIAETQAAREALNRNLVNDAALEYSQRQKVAGITAQQNTAEVERLKTAQLIQSATKAASETSTLDRINSVTGVTSGSSFNEYRAFSQESALINQLKEEAQKEQAARSSLLSAAQNSEKAALGQGFTPLVSSLREAERGTQSVGSGLRRMGNEADSAGYFMRKLQTLMDSIFRGQRGAAMSTIGSMFRDSEKLSDLGGPALGGLVGGGLLLSETEHLARWSSEMSKAAMDAQNLAAASGMTTDAMLSFSSAVQLAGGNSTTASRALEAVQSRMEESVLNPTGHAMQAFQRLGISWEELRDKLNDPGGALAVLNQLADAFVKTGHTPEGIADFRELAGGRQQLAEIVPLLSKGRQGIEDLGKEGNSLAPGLHQYEENLVHMEEQIKRLEQAWQGFKASIVGSGSMFDGLISGAIKWLQAFQNGQLIYQKGIEDLVLGAHGPGTPPKAGDGTFTPQEGSTVKDALNKLATVDTRLADTFKEAANRTLGSAGYSVQVTGGHATSGHAPDSQHYTQTGAIDFTIYDQAGNRIGREAAKVIGSEAYNIYMGFGDKFTELSPGAGRNGMRFKVPDPGHVDFGLLNGAPAGANALPLQGQGQGFNGVSNQSPFDVKAAEQYYLAKLHAAEATLKDLHNNEQLMAVLKLEQEYATKSPTDRSNFLQGNLGSIGKIEAESATQELDVLNKQRDLRKSIVEEQNQEAIAALKKQQVQAESASDTQKVLELQRQIEALVKSNPYNSQVQAIEASTQSLQKQIAVQKQSVELAIEAASAQTRANESILAGYEAQNKTSVEQHKLKPQTADLADIGMVIQLEGQEKETLDKIMESTKDVATQTKIYWQEWELGISSQTKVLELTKQIAEENKKLADNLAKPFTQFFDSVGSGFEKLFENAITKSQTAGQAFKGFFKSLATDATKIIGDELSKLAAQQLSKLISVPLQEGGGLGSLLGSATSKLFNLGTDTAKTTATATAITTAMATGGTTAGTAIATSMTAAGTAAGAEIAAAMTAASAAGAGGSGITSALQAASVAAFAQGGIVPSAAGGMVVPGGAARGGQLSILHPQEMVLPAPISRGLQNMISTGGSNDNAGGGSSTTFNYNANVTGYQPFATRSAFESMLRSHGNAMQGWAENLVRNRSLKFG